MARAITVDELAKLRGNGQRSRFGLAFHRPETVFSAVAGLSSIFDQVASINYTGAVGNYADVKPGMTLYIGSEAGAHDIGMLRIRRAPTSNTLYFSETSDIVWTETRYLTVVNEYGLWAKHWKLPDDDPTHVRMDFDVGYTNQQSVFDPVPVLGPDWITYSGTVAPSALGSWAFGSDIASYLWTAPGASSALNMNTAAPTIQYNSPGQYLISCTVTTVAGKSHTGHRNVFVYGGAVQPHTDFRVDSCEGSYDAGGWSFSVTCYGGLTPATVRDRAKIHLFAIEESYGSALGSLGPLPSHENIICSGWIDGESISWDPAAGGTVSFTVRGPQYWLSRNYSFPLGVKYSDDPPTNWLYLQGLSVDSAVWNLLHWRSTATAVLDIFLTGNENALPAGEAPAGSIWSQLEAVASAVMAKPVCDRYGRLFVELDYQYRPSAGRVGVPVVMAVTESDFTPPVTIDRRPAAQVAILDTSGIAYGGMSGSSPIATPYLSRAPGYSPKQYGRSEAVDRLLVTNQGGLNELTGLILGQRNNEFPNTSIDFAANNRFVDVAPVQLISLTIDGEDDAGGRFFWTSMPLIPRAVSFRISTAGGFLISAVDAEAVTSAENSVTIPVPEYGQPNFPVPPLVNRFAPLPDGVYFPDIVYPSGTGDEGQDYETYQTGCDCMRSLTFDCTPPVVASNNINLIVAEDIRDYDFIEPEDPQTIPPDEVWDTSLTTTQIWMIYHLFGHPLSEDPFPITELVVAAGSESRTHPAHFGIRMFGGDNPTSIRLRVNLDVFTYSGTQENGVTHATVANAIAALPVVQLILSGPELADYAVDFAADGWTAFGGIAIEQTVSFPDWTHSREVTSLRLKFISSGDVLCDDGNAHPPVAVHAGIMVLDGCVFE